MTGIDGGVLRGWRRSCNWDVPRLAREIRRAAGDGDPVAVHDALVRMIRRWERTRLTDERYELLYRSLGFGTRPPLPDDRPASGSAPAAWTQPWELAGTLTRSSLSLTAVGIMEEAVSGLAARYPYTPPAQLIPDLQPMITTVNGALGEAQALQVRGRCVRVAGILAGVAGQLADDTGRPDQSAAWFSTARVAADEAVDPDLAAWALALRAIGCHFRSEYARSAQLLDEARDAAALSAPRRQAWLAALAARAQAATARQQGAAAPGVMRAVGDARRALESAGPADSTDFFDAPRLAGMAGTALLLLGDTSGAREQLGEALSGRAAGDVKGRALLTLDLAECHAADGEPDAAADLAARALTMAEGSASIVQPVTTRAAAVCRVLQPWAGTAAVAGLGDRIAGITAAGTED
jgi:hypothetical protein